MTTTKSGVELIAAERERQINGEGWTLKHDDRHDGGELARAAAWYALASLACPWTDSIGVAHRDSAARGLFRDDFYGWPWFEGEDRKYRDPEWFKSAGSNSGTAGAIRDLVKAGALIAAELDRLQRLAAQEDPT